jgi:hypothetical protein
MIKKFNQFNESNNDAIVEILIILEDIQKALRKGVCPMKILNDDPIIFEWHMGAIYSDLIGKNFKPHHHYEKVSIDTDSGEIVIKWLDVIDNNWAHYTPNELRFNNVEDTEKFLKKRYLDNSWEVRKVKKGRYLIDDGIDDIPHIMR